MTRLVGHQFGAGASAAPAVPFAAIDQSAVIAEFQRRLAELEKATKLSVPADRILSAIAMTSDTMLLAAEKIALFGEVTFADWHRDVTGQATGDIDPSLTQIRGGVIRTGKIVSFAGDAYVDLDASGAAAFIHSAGVSIAANGSFSFGGAAGGGKRLTWDGSDLRIEGSALVGTSGGKTMADVIVGAEDGSSALVGLTSKLNKSGTDTLSGQVSFASAGAMKIVSGTLTVASDGTVSGSGSGVLLTQKGIVHVDAGTITMSLPITGRPVFGGDLSAAGGSFSGSIYTAETVYAAGSHSTADAGTVTGLNSYTTGIGVYGAATHASGLCTGVRGVVTSTNANSRGVDGYSQYGIGVRGIAAGTGVGILAGNDGGASALSLQVKTKALFEGVVDIQSSLQCDSLRIDQSPATGSATATFPGNNKPGGNSTCSWLSLNLNGTTYYLPAWT